MSTSRWSGPVFCALTGVLFFTLFAINDKVGEGLVAAAVMLVYGGVLLLGGRSQFVRQLRGQNDDERLVKVEQDAARFAGYVLLTAVLIGFVQAIARDVDAQPYAALGGLSGVAYLCALGWLRWRS